MKKLKKILKALSEGGWKGVVDLALAVSLASLAGATLSGLIAFAISLLGPIGASIFGAVLGAVLGYCTWIFSLATDPRSDYWFFS